MTLPSSVDTMTLEEHLAILIDKLEAQRETQEATKALGQRFRPNFQTEIRTLEFWRAIISECFATFLLVFVVSGAGLGGAELKGARSGGAAGLGGTESNLGVILTTMVTMGVALATGMTMGVLTECFGRISGGHVNPAVTIALAVIKKISPLRAGMYVLAQCGGAIGGAALLYGVAKPPATPQKTFSSWESFGVELVLTFVIVLTYCSANERKLLNRAPILMGAAYTGCCLVERPMLNPARALGPAFVINKEWESHWVYWFGPIFGGIVAALIFEFIFNSKRQKRLKDSIDGDSSSIQSDDEQYEDGKYHPGYRPVAPNANAINGNYCASTAASVYSSPPGGKTDRESIYGKKPISEGIYSGTRSLYNAKIGDDTKSPVLTRSSLNRSQSVYAKNSRDPRDLLPKPGPLVPAQSLYPIKIGGHLAANIREFVTGDGNFITGVKTDDGNFVKVNPPFNQAALNFLSNRGGSKSYHDINEPEKAPNFAHAANQNVQNQQLANKPVENMYGVRGCPPGGTGGLYPDPRGQSLQRTAAYVKSIQSSPQHKLREHYDVVPSGIREVRHNRSETSDYGSHRSDTSYLDDKRPDKPEGAKKSQDRGELPPLPPQPQSMRILQGTKEHYIQPPRQSPLSSVSSNGFSRSSPNPPY